MTAGKRTIYFLVLCLICIIFGASLMTQLYPQFYPPPIQIIYKATLPESLLQEWVMGQSSRCSPKQVKLIVQECIKTDIPLLILALIAVESEFNSTAVSSKGAMGLGQIMFFHHSKALQAAGIIKEQRDLFDIEANIKATSFVLGMYLKQNNGDVGKALERYLGGQDGVYQKKILSNLSNLYVKVTGKKEEGK